VSIDLEITISYIMGIGDKKYLVSMTYHEFLAHILSSDQHEGHPVSEIPY